jgi:hypothetical protein
MACKQQLVTFFVPSTESYKNLQVGLNNPHCVVAAVSTFSQRTLDDITNNLAHGGNWGHRNGCGGPCI